MTRMRISRIWMKWKITADSEEQTYFDLEFYFYKYERVQK